MKAIALALIAVLLLQTLPMIVGTLSVLSMREAIAQGVDQEIDFTEQLVERAHTSEIYALGNSGQYRAILGLDPWVYDESQGRYVPHTVATLPDGTIQVRSGMIGWLIGPDDAVITDPEGREERTREVWRFYLGQQELEKTFSLQTVTEYDNVVRVINRYDMMIADGTKATLSISYSIYAGKPTERIVQILGVSDELKSQVRIEREWRDIDTDEVLYATSESQSSDTIALTRKSLSPGEDGEYVRLIKGDKLVVHENLRTAGDKLKQVEYDSSLVKFAYSGWEAKTTVKLTDDTFSGSSGPHGYVSTSSTTGTSCGSPSSTSFGGQSTAFTFLAASGSNSFCRLAAFEWSISSLPSDANVSSTAFKFQVGTSSNAVNCHVTPMTNRPSSSAASTVWNDILDGTPYVSNGDFCTTTGTNKSLDLGSAANADVESQIASGWFAIGVPFVDLTRDSSARDVRISITSATPSPTLEIMYTTPQQYDRTPGDTIEFSDSIAVLLAAARPNADSWITSESIARMYHSFRSVAETATISDSASRKLAGSRSPSDSVAVSESIVSTYVSARPVSDAVAVSDTIGATYTPARATSDTITVNDAPSYMLNASRLASDSLTVSDSITTTVLTARSTSDSWVTSDSIATAYSANRSMSDSWSTSDSIAIQLNIGRAPSDSVMVSDSIATIYVEAVEIPITLLAGSNSPTLQAQGASVTISCQYGGSHDGDPDQQEFQCFANETVTLSLPSSTATERWVWSNGSTGDMSFTACNTGTCDEQTFTYYRQLKQTVTLSGLDAIRTASVSLTQVGNSGSSAVSGSTLTALWADQGTQFTIPSTVTIVTNEDRFKSYDDTSDLSYTVTSANTKVITYAHEFNMLFRVHEEHLGEIFAPMPAAVFTGTVTTSNSTALSLTFNTQVTDDYLQPSEGRYWVTNGTATWTDITWRGLVVNAAGSQSITAYGNFDIESASKHYGYPGNRHFRLAVDNGTIDEQSVVFDVNAATFGFDAAATGNRAVKLEFLANLYEGASGVRVNGTSHDPSKWTIESIDSLTKVLVVSDVGFSTNTFLIDLIPASTTGPSGGGSTSGGGGGSGPTGPLSTIPDLFPSQSGVTVRVNLPDAVVIKPGETQTIMMTVEGTGTTKLVLSSITFGQYESWFVIGQPLPLALTLEPGQDRIRHQVPIMITVPQTEQGVLKVIDVKVRAESAYGTAETNLPLTVTLGSTNDFAVITGLAVLGIVGAVIAVRRAKKR